MSNEKLVNQAQLKLGNVDEFANAVNELKDSASGEAAAVLHMGYAIDAAKVENENLSYEALAEKVINPMLKTYGIDGWKEAKTRQSHSVAVANELTKKLVDDKGTALYPNGALESVVNSESIAMTVRCLLRFAKFKEDANAAAQYCAVLISGEATPSKVVDLIKNHGKEEKNKKDAEAAAAKEAEERSREIENYMRALKKSVKDSKEREAQAEALYISAKADREADEEVDKALETADKKRIERDLKKVKDGTLTSEMVSDFSEPHQTDVVWGDDKTAPLSIRGVFDPETIRGLRYAVRAALPKGDSFNPFDDNESLETLVDKAARLLAASTGATIEQLIEKS